MSQIDDEIYVEIDDKIDNNNDIHYKIDIDNDINKPHNGKLVTKIEVSPNEKYLVTYSKDDHSIVGWNIESKDKSQLKLDKTFKLSDMILLQMCVSDNKKLAYINENKYLEIYDMKKNQKIKLDCDPRFSHYYYCTFNLNGEFILYGRFDRIIFIYSTRTKNNKWNCKRMYKKQNNFKFISISKYNKLYSFSNNSIYEYNLITEKSKKIFGSNEKITNKNIRISSNEKFICIRIINKLIIYSIELEIPIASWDINNDTQLHNFVYRAGLIPLLLPLLNDSTIMEHYWNECLDWLRGKGQLSNEYQTESLSDIIRTTTKYVFGILDGHIWKIKFEEILSKMNLTFENTDENIENWYFDNDFKISNEIHKTYDHLNIHLIKPSMGMDTIYALFQKVKPHSKNKKELESSQNLIKWEISTIDTYKIRLQVFKKINVNNQWNEEDLICTRVENVNESYSINLLGIKLLDDSDIIILTSIDNKESLLKYGVELLTFGIKEHNLELIEDIYKTCIKYFNEDLRNNRMYLSIITSTMPLLSEYYPEYISRYSLETTMIIDPSFYKLIIPQSSPYVKTINRDIYKTWNGETLIDFKWNTYGKYYYIIIWIGFIFLLGCFTAAATIPQQFINDDIQQQLLIISIVLGFIHLNFEIRQFIYNPIKWIHNFWNIFEYTNNSDDLNNPWNIVPTYHQVFENGTIDLNSSIIQQPDENTNMFVDFGTSLFAIYYYANVDKTREKIKEMINEGEWNTNEFSELKQKLLKELNIQYDFPNLVNK
ncbi:hypothetical protein GLOIN_2v1794049 [Rhizophagus irregularis DAOM 181602=DAOM 197198]|nr:hypothetical protein GLOIN_2v1794049 [Rhizophagus irregularis DAOM 181602=DAOM 197198]